MWVPDFHTQSHSFPPSLWDSFFVCRVGVFGVPVSKVIVRRRPQHRTGRQNRDLIGVPLPLPSLWERRVGNQPPFALKLLVIL